MSRLSRKNADAHRPAPVCWWRSPGGVVLVSNATDLAPRKRPCSTCPYRRDVPSGIWAAGEYAKLPGYDGDIPEQVAAGAFSLFFCHQKDGSLCAGWAGCHDMGNTLAVRMHAAHVSPVLFDYVPPLPLFASGAEAAAHGMRDIAEPGPAARRKISQLLRLRARRQRTGMAATQAGEE